MLWFLFARCFSALLQLLLLSRQTDRSKDLQILLLRRQLDIAQRKLDKPIRPSRTEKFLLALLTVKFKQMTRLPINKLQDVILIIQPTTVLKWHRDLVRKKWTYRQRSRGGRPKIDAELESLIVRLAHENDWGNGKIAGELLKLGYKVSDQTIANILKRYGIPPLPQRRPSLSWYHLMSHYKDQILACDFFTVETLFLQTVYALFFIELGSRRVHLAGCTTRPSGTWVAQQARQMVWQIQDDDARMRFLLRDNDSKFTTSFDTVFASEHIEVIRTPYKAPNANAYAERWVRSVREECLDKLLVLNQAHLRRVLRDYIDYYNTARPHQGIGQQIPEPRPIRKKLGNIRCRTTLGILNDYYRDAA
jgi:putative transposase